MGKRLDNLVMTVDELVTDGMQPSVLKGRKAQAAFEDIVDEQVMEYEARSTPGRAIKGLARGAAVAATVGYVSGGVRGAISAVKQNLYGVQGPGMALGLGIHKIAKVAGHKTDVQKGIEQNTKSALYMAEHPGLLVAATAATAAVGAGVTAGVAYVSKKLGVNVSPKLMAKVGATGAVLGGVKKYLQGRKFTNEIKQRVLYK